MPSSTRGTHHATAVPAYSTATDVDRIGSSPKRASRARTTVPATRPPAASASGGSPLLSSAEITKYDAAPTIAPSAHSMPTRLRSAPENRSRTSASPTAATAAPSSVIRPGRWWCRSHIQTTTAAGAVYSMRRAGPTCMNWMAEK